MGPYDSAHQVAELTRQVRAIGADLDAERRSRYDSDRDAARLREKLERVTSDLARVEAERDEAMAALEGASNALGGLELYELSETAGHVETAVADRDEALADLARVEAERDEARAKVATVGWRWSHDIPSVTCPKCGGTTSNPFEDHEHITDESEEVAVCEECEHEFWVTAFYRAQFRFDVQEYEPDAEALGVRS